MTAPARREPWLDCLRALACFLVIVNHTNSYVFKASAPGDVSWWLSILWYYVSKIAVPLFMLASGACLLPKRDTYRRAGLRLLRVLGALVLFSYVYYLADAARTGLTWRKAVGLRSFLAAVWQGPITDSYWYLYFYAGLMALLPPLQRFAQAADKRDLRYLIGLSFGVCGLWPIAEHYVPALALPPYLPLTEAGGLIGLFFAGHYLRAYAKPARRPACWAIVAGTLALSAALTYLEYVRVGGKGQYWFMDDRTAPSILTVACACAAACLAKAHAFTARSGARWTALGGCAFGVYLLGDLLIAETRYRLFVPLSGAIPPFLAALCWEIVVFAAALAVAWGMKKVPGLRKLL